MKNILISLVLLGMGSTAYASKARLLALGQDKDDNYFISDSRSIFVNAAYVNEYADTITMEWGDSGTAFIATASGGGLDTDGSPKAMGGALMTYGNLVYGVYLGNESDTGVLLHGAASDTDYATSNQLSDADNVIDLFVAGDTGSIKWGWNFLYSKSETEDSITPVDNSKNDAMATRLGMIMGDIEAYANISLGNEADRPNTTNKAKFEGSLGFHVGGSYTMGANKLIASYKQLDWDQSFGATPVKTGAGYTKTTVGWGHTLEVGSAANVYTQAYYESTQIEIRYATDPADMNHTIVPIVVGFEAKATDWLTLRGSVKHNLMGRVKEKGIGSHFSGAFRNVLIGKFGVQPTTGTTENKRTLPNSTDVSGGATLHFGKLSIDGLIGATDSSRTGTVANAATGNAEEGVLTLDNLLVRVGLLYAF